MKEDAITSKAFGPEQRSFVTVKETAWHLRLCEKQVRRLMSRGELPAYQFGSALRNEEDTRLEAAECIRELIEEIRLVPKRGQLEIELYGELAALINLANGHPRSKGTGVQVTLVAGRGFEPLTFRL